MKIITVILVSVLVVVSPAASAARGAVRALIGARATANAVHPGLTAPRLGARGVYVASSSRSSTSLSVAVSRALADARLDRMKTPLPVDAAAIGSQPHYLGTLAAPYFPDPYIRSSKSHPLRRDIRDDLWADRFLFSRYCKTGDSYAFLSLKDKHQSLVERMLSNNGVLYQDRADAAQTVWERVVRSRPQGTCPADHPNPTGWLATVAINVAKELREQPLESFDDIPEPAFIPRLEKIGYLTIAEKCLDSKLRHGVDRQIASMKLKGFGTTAIAKRLSASNIPNMSRQSVDLRVALIKPVLRECYDGYLTTLSAPPRAG